MIYCSLVITNSKTIILQCGRIKHISNIYNFVYISSLVLGLLSVLMLALLFIASSKKMMMRCARARRIVEEEEMKKRRRRDSELIGIIEEDLVKRMQMIFMMPIYARRVEENKKRENEVSGENASQVYLK